MSKIGNNKIVVEGILWSSVLYIISIIAYITYTIIQINQDLSVPFLDPYLIIVNSIGTIAFVFWIIALIYWGKYDKKVRNFLPLFFLHIMFMPFYSRILQKKMNDKTTD